MEVVGAAGALVLSEDCVMESLVMNRAEGDVTACANKSGSREARMPTLGAKYAPKMGHPVSEVR